eukprot:8422-Rhodomonas_salina.2
MCIRDRVYTDTFHVPLLNKNGTKQLAPLQRSGTMSTVKFVPEKIAGTRLLIPKYLMPAKLLGHVWECSSGDGCLPLAGWNKCCLLAGYHVRDPNAGCGCRSPGVWFCRVALLHAFVESHRLGPSVVLG